MIAIVKDTELKGKFKAAYESDECAKRVLMKTEGSFTINEQGLI
jgi:hypothetical protein